MNADIPWKFDVLDFLEFGTSTAASDYFGFIVLTETGQKIAGRAACMPYGLQSPVVKIVTTVSSDIFLTVFIDIH